MKTVSTSPRILKALFQTSLASVTMLLCALIGALLSGSLTSCDHKELDRLSASCARVRVLFDWRKAPGASAKGMSLYLYPQTGGDPLRYDFPNASGGTVEIPFGRYRALFLNNDSETLLLRGTERFASFELYTRTSTLLEPLGLQGNPEGANPPDEPVVLAPDALWAGQEDPVELSLSDLRADPTVGDADKEITLYPQGKTCTYTVEIRRVQNLKYTSALSFSLSGLSGNLFAGRGERSSLRSTIPFPAKADGAAEKVTARFLCFGTSTSANPLRTLSLYVILSDGSKQYYTFDVSAQVNEAPDPKNVHILIEGLNLPKPIANGGGFHPTIDEWQSITEEINM